MKFQADNLECPTEDIVPFIDGELSLTRELELEAHFSKCAVCLDELNQQKLFLQGLDLSLKHEREMDLPSDFAKVIVANAESTVSGLRRPRERFNAIFVCVGICLFVLFAMGAEAGKVFGGMYVFIDQISAVGEFFGHLIYTFFLGVAIVLRSFAAQLSYDAVMALLLTGLVVALTFLLSRKVLRMRRA